MRQRTSGERVCTKAERGLSGEQEGVRKERRKLEVRFVFWKTAVGEVGMRAPENWP